MEALLLAESTENPAGAPEIVSPPEPEDREEEETTTSMRNSKSLTPSKEGSTTERSTMRGSQTSRRIQRTEAQEIQDVAKEKEIIVGMIEAKTEVVGSAEARGLEKPIPVIAMALVGIVEEVLLKVVGEGEEMTLGGAETMKAIRVLTPIPMSMMTLFLPIESPQDLVVIEEIQAEVEETPAGELRGVILAELAEGNRVEANLDRTLEEVEEGLETQAKVNSARIRVEAGERVGRPVEVNLVKIRVEVAEGREIQAEESLVKTRTRVGERLENLQPKPVERTQKEGIEGVETGVAETDLEELTLWRGLIDEPSGKRSSRIAGKRRMASTIGEAPEDEVLRESRNKLERKLPGRLRRESALRREE